MERSPECLPPTRPDAWAAQDADLRTQVRLLATPGDPYRGTAACGCGGEWRYLLADHRTRWLYRCLHCGEPGLEDATTPPLVGPSGPGAPGSGGPRGR